MRRALVLLCLLPAVARAAPTGLNQIPTTDLMPFKQLMLQLQNSNTEIRGDHSVFHRPTLVYQSEFGLPGRLEAGLDVQPANPPHDYRPVLNLKWSPIREGSYNPAAAVGITQVGPDFDPNYFLVLSKTINYSQIQYQKFRAHHRNIKLRGIRLHAGVLGTRDVPRGFVGTDIELADRFVLYADWVSGREHAATLAGVVVIDQANSFQIAAFYGNHDQRIDGVLLTLTHIFAW